MDQVVLPGTFNSCLYPKDGIIDCIVGMYLLGLEAFQNLREQFGGADPEYIYIAQEFKRLPNRTQAQRTVPLAPDGLQSREGSS
jgi:hypothetical protein